MDGPGWNMSTRGLIVGTRTEDKLFRILTRTPYPEMRRKYNEFYMRAFPSKTAEIVAEAGLFESNGWTHREFMDAALKEKKNANG
jgi:hypothetical protein